VYFKKNLRQSQTAARPNAVPNSIKEKVEIGYDAAPGKHSNRPSRVDIAVIHSRVCDKGQWLIFSFLHLSSSAWRSKLSPFEVGSEGSEAGE
jgi:hypothetical protein